MFSTRKKFSEDISVGNNGMYVKINKKIWSIIIILTGILPIINTLGNPRIFEAKNIEYVQSGYSSDNSYLISQIKYASYFLIIILAVVLYLLTLRQGKRLDNYSLFLVLSLLFFKITLLIAGFWGTKPIFMISDYIIFILFTIIAMLTPISINRLINQIKIILLIYIYGSLALAIIYPEFAVQTNYMDGYLFHIRLFGITVHSNILASLAGLFLIIETNWASGRLRKLHIISALVVLMVTQSKTVWIIMMVISLFLLLYRIWIKSHKKIKYLVISFLHCLFALMLLSIFILLSVIAGKYLTTEQVNQFYTLTGRNDVWSFTMSLWSENPWFGYGPSLWSDMDMRMTFYRYYGWLPGSAHNQFFQSIGEAGILGAISLILYSVALIYISMKTAKKTGGVSIALVIFLLSRGLTEVSFRDNLTDNNFTIHFFVICIFLHLLYQNKNNFYKK